jgi:hypothetical protein
MTWYAATIVSVVRVRTGKQKSFPVWEDVCLIEATSDDEAFQKAEALGKSREIDDQTTTLDDIPASVMYLGVRKVGRIINPFPEAPDESPPRHGSEISFSKYTLASEKDLDLMVQGKSVPVIYEE